MDNNAGGEAKTAKATAARSIAASLLACYKPAPSDGATPARTAPSHGATDQVPCTVGRCSQADFHDSAAPSYGAYLDGCHLSEQRAACLTSSATAQPAQEDSAAEIRATANLVVVESLNSLMATAQRSAAMRQLGLDPVLGAIAADPSPATWPADNDGHSMLIRVAPPELTAVSTQESTACPSRFAPFA